MAIILVTGSATGIGNLTARELARGGHTVYAGVLDADGRNAAHSDELRAFAAADESDLTVVELDVTSQRSANEAVAEIMVRSGGIDVVVHNAGHLVVGYTEAFTVEQIAALFDINTFGPHRVNRAALPFMRERGQGYLLYIGSTSSVVSAPFMAPYAASKIATDMMAQTAAFELNELGIETTVLMPGAFRTGTAHFADATLPADTTRLGGYARLDALRATFVAPATEQEPPPGRVTPHDVAVEVRRLIDLPRGARPPRSVVSDINDVVEPVTDLTQQQLESVMADRGLDQLLRVRL